MTITQIIASFAHDEQVKLVVSLIAADFILGVLASLVAPEKAGAFRLSYVANFARNDLLGKVAPWAVVFALDKATHAATIVGPVDWSQANTAAFLLVTAAMGGSILVSLADLGLPAPQALAGHAGTVVAPRQV